MLLAPMIARLKSQPDLSLALETAVRDVVALHGAEFGNVQLLAEDGRLWIVGHKGLLGTFVREFAQVSQDAGTACARAWRGRATVFIHDVTIDPPFRPYLDVARRVGFRAVVSSPLISSKGEAIGVISAHFAHTKAPTGIEITTLESYCRQLADNLLERASAAELAARTPQLHEEMLQRSRLTA